MSRSKSKHSDRPQSSKKNRRVASLRPEMDCLEHRSLLSLFDTLSSPFQSLYNWVQGQIDNHYQETGAANAINNSMDQAWSNAQSIGPLPDYSITLLSGTKEAIEKTYMIDVSATQPDSSTPSTIKQVASKALDIVTTTWKENPSLWFEAGAAGICWGVVGLSSVPSLGVSTAIGAPACMALTTIAAADFAKEEAFEVSKQYIDALDLNPTTKDMLHRIVAAVETGFSLYDAA